MIFYKRKKQKTPHFAYFFTDEDEKTTNKPKQQNDKADGEPKQEENSDDS